MLVAGRGFLGSRSLLVFKTKRVEEIKRGKDYFLLISYQFSSKTLGVKLREGKLPHLLIFEVQRLGKFKPPRGNYQLRLLKQNLKVFKEGVLKLKELIKEGVLYQANLTTRFDFSFKGEPLSLFYDYIKRQPVPYCFYLDAGDFKVISGSMELFLKKKGQRLITRPIKGTSQDCQELIKSEKDKAENLMIVDVARNDLGRVCKVGSVKVTKLFSLQRYKTLCHLVSQVEGKTDQDLWNIILNTFPPASISGAPKKKALQVLEELEPHTREYYCGCGGFIFKNGDFTLSVLIRTAILFKDSAYYYTGGGITHYSKPQEEVKEALLKLKAFFP